MTIEFRKTAGASCRHCYVVPSNEMVIFPGNWKNGKYYLCQECAKQLKDELSELNFSGNILSISKPESRVEDLSNI